MSNITRRLNHILQNINDSKLSDVAFKEFYKITPIRSGNARNNTKKQQNAVYANYPYAKRLNEGYSKQAPDGMTEPTIETVRNYVFKTTGIKI